MNEQYKLVELSPLIKITSSRHLIDQLSEKFKTENNLAIMIQKNVRRFLAKKKFYRMNKENFDHKLYESIVKIQSNFRRYIVQKRIKHTLMLKKIIEHRRKASDKIFDIIRCYNFRKNLLIYTIRHKILSSRLNAVLKIQSFNKIYNLRKDIKNILTLETKFYSLTYPFKANSVRIKIFINTNDEIKEKVYDFQYCKLRKIFILYIDPTDFSPGIYRVSFIIDNLETCDGRFPHVEFSDGNYYNIIEFRLPWEKKKAKSEDNLAYLNTSSDLNPSPRNYNEDITDYMIRSKSNSIDENLVNDLKDRKAKSFMEISNKNYKIDF